MSHFRLIEGRCVHRRQAKHWHGDRAESARLVGELADRVGATTVLDLGPGDRPCPRATHLAGRVRHGGGPRLLEANFLIPNFLAKAEGWPPRFDLAVCAHTVEDLTEPCHLLRCVQEVGRACYLETPSVLAECCTDVDAGECVPWKGYRHHHWLCWTDAEGVFCLVAKHPLLEHYWLDGTWSGLLVDPERWVHRHVCAGPLRWKIYRNEIDYHLMDPGSYLAVVEGALGLLPKGASQ